VLQTTNKIIQAALNANKMNLTEPEAKSLCREYSIPTPDFKLARNGAEAENMPKELGLPLVAKVVSSQVTHKTDAGGVLLNIRTAEEAKAAFSTILKRVHGYNPNAQIEGVMFEKMQPPGVEVIVGATDDPQFGKTLVFGMGGVFVEALSDVTFRLAPVTEDEARGMLSDIRAHALLAGYRGAGPVDANALTRILTATSKLITENEEIVGLDFNPVIANEKNAVVADARIVLAKTAQRAAPQALYPATSLLKFFKAESVAVIGASATPGKIGHEVLRSLAQHEYMGKVYPVNPSSESILGLKAYRNILDVPWNVDLAVFTIASKSAPLIMDECGRKGVKAVVIVSGGFKETGMEDIERETVAAARKYGMRIIGPNCIGVFDGHSRLDTFFQSHERMLRPAGGSAAFITQSGTFGATILEWAAEEGIGVSKFVSYGNRCDVDEGDLVDFFAQDKETSLVGIYVEGLENGRKLFDVARNLTKRKPIVILKSGRTSVGSKAAKSHTGWLAGSYPVAKAAFEQAGMVVTESVDQLFDAVKALAMQPPPRGRNLVMVTNGAGPVVMAVDRLSKCGMKVAPLTESTASELKEKLPPYCFISETTVDLTGSATSHDYEVSFAILGRADEVHVLMPFFVFQDTPLDEGIVAVLERAKKCGKPMVCCAGGGPYTRMMSKRIQAFGIPVYETAERAVNAVQALVRQAEVMGLAKPEA
jgi:3-hydroxypropionyl-CoA synthetase (ADP-forming)